MARGAGREPEAARAIETGGDSFNFEARGRAVTDDSDPEIQELRAEVNKLGRVVSEVLGSEFDTILSRQADDQRSVMQWVATSIALNLAMVHLLAERGLIDEEVVLARTREIRSRLLHHIESMGTDADVAQMFGGFTTEAPEDR
jgi:hypothetical protein